VKLITHCHSPRLECGLSYTSASRLSDCVPRDGSYSYCLYIFGYKLMFCSSEQKRLLKPEYVSLDPHYLNCNFLSHDNVKFRKGLPMFRRKLLLHLFSRRSSETSATTCCNNPKGPQTLLSPKRKPEIFL